MADASTWKIKDYYPSGDFVMIVDAKGNRIAEAIRRENAELILRAVSNNKD